jgi:hypothetical protein
MAIASVNAASATAPNWLKEAQEALTAAQAPGGLLGALQDTRYDGGSLKNYLARSQNAAANIALIAMNKQTSSASLIAQMAGEAAQKRMEEKAALAAKFNAVPVNYTPPHELDPFIYFEDGSNIDTTNNILTLQNGIQIDTTTGLEVIDPASIIQMANGAYLDTKKNIMTMPDGTKIDTITGLAITV